MILFGKSHFETLCVQVHGAKPTAKALGTLASAGSAWMPWLCSWPPGWLWGAHMSFSVPLFSLIGSVKIKHEHYAKLFACPECSNSERRKMLYPDSLSHPQEGGTIRSQPHSVDYRGPKSFSNALGFLFLPVKERLGSWVG